MPPKPINWRMYSKMAVAYVPSAFSPSVPITYPSYLPMATHPSRITRANIPCSGLTCCVGGPALIYYVSPTEEELFLRYNPELQKRSLENRVGKQEDFDNFVARLKEYSKSDRPSMFLDFSLFFPLGQWKGRAEV